MKKSTLGTWITLLFIPAMAFSLDARGPEVVTKFDTKSYMGLWYEIAHKPNFFQRNCQYSTAEYTLNENDEIGVFNTCYRDKKIYSTIQGTATPPNPSVPTKLKVDFGFFIKGDYWIVDLDENYQWAVVSGPRYKSLFILARTAPMEPALLEKILTNLNNKGVNTRELIFDKYEGQ